MVTSLRYVLNELLVTLIIELTIRLVIAQLHRIPHGRSDESDRFGNESFVQRRPVFLQHGMFCSDIFWLLSSSNNSLGLHSLQLSSFFWKVLTCNFLTVHLSLHFGWSRLRRLAGQFKREYLFAKTQVTQSRQRRSILELFVRKLYQYTNPEFSRVIFFIEYNY